MQRPVVCLCHAQMLLISTIVLLTPHSARANLINNGSFEVPTVTSASQYLDIAAGAEPAGFDWHVASGSVDIGLGGGFFPPAFDGTQYLDLDGFVPGAINQSFPTTPGTTYDLSFAYANNPYGGAPPASCVPPSTSSCATIPALATVTVLDAGTSTELITPLALTHGNSTVANANWTSSGQIAFVADGTMTTLSFVSNDPSDSNGGIFLDDVSANAASAAVPEPNSLLLLLSAFAVGGIASYLRQRSSSAPLPGA
jgi:hypothetical protein